MAKPKTTQKHAQGSNTRAKASSKPVFKAQSSHKRQASDGPTDDQTTNSEEHEVCLACKKAKWTEHVDEEVDEDEDEDDLEEVDVPDTNDEHEGPGNDHDKVLCTSDEMMLINHLHTS